MEYTEESVYRALGLDPNGANVQEPAEPAAEPTEIGAQVQEPAEPATKRDEDNEPSGQPAAEAVSEEEPPGDEGKQDANGDNPLTPEQRRENAAKRRKQELEAAVQKAVAEEREKADAQLKSFFSSAGLKNSLTGKPITTMEEFRQWEKDYKGEKLKRDLKAGKLTQDSLNAAIEQNPAVQQAKQLLEQQKKAEEQQQAELTKQRIAADIAKIHERDAGISTMQDLLNSPKSKEIYQYIQKGNTVYDAWWLANREMLETAAAEGARTQAMRNQAGKGHLVPAAGTRGTGGVSVPADEMRIFKLLNPKATDEEIRKYYNRKDE